MSIKWIGRKKLGNKQLECYIPWYFGYKRCIYLSDGNLKVKAPIAKSDALFQLPKQSNKGNDDLVEQWTLELLRKGDDLS